MSDIEALLAVAGKTSLEEASNAFGETLPTNPSWYDWTDANPQTVREATNLVFKEIMECNGDTNYEDYLIADILGVDAATMHKQGRCGSTGVFTIEVAEAGHLGFEKFSIDERLRIACDAAGWGGDCVFHAIPYNKAI